MMTSQDDLKLKKAKLINEYSQLVDELEFFSTQKLKEISKRIKEIQIEIDEIKKIDNEYDNYKEFTANIEMYTREQVAKIFNVHVDTVSTWIETNALKAIKAGRRYMFTKKSIEEFQKNFEGLDVSNIKKTLESIEILKRKRDEKQ